jgi:Domain of unknown function (DUF4193)
VTIDYDAPRTAAVEEAADSLEELKADKGSPRAADIDVDEPELEDGFELPGADLSDLVLQVQVVPVQADEFTCMSCFLVHHRSQVAREKDGREYCAECEG